MTKVLLTGASGFMGQYVLRALLENNIEVIAPVRDAASMRSIYRQPEVTFLEGQFYSDALLEQYRQHQPEMIIHLAAIRGDGNGSWKKYLEVNVNGTERLVRYALENRLKKFLYCSTVGIYGTVPSRIPADPYTSAEADGYYHQSKLLAEKIILNHLRGHVPLAIFRPTISYGFGDDGFLVKMISMVRKRVFPLMSSQVLIHLLDVNSFGELMVLAVRKKLDDYHIVNVADKNPVQLSQLVDVIHSHFFEKPYPRYMRTPQFFHRFSEWATQVLKMRGAHISVKLISNDWYYDTSNLENIFHLPLKNTPEAVDYYLKHSFPRNGANG